MVSAGRSRWPGANQCGLWRRNDPPIRGRLVRFPGVIQELLRDRQLITVSGCNCTKRTTAPCRQQDGLLQPPPKASDHRVVGIFGSDRYPAAIIVAPLFQRLRTPKDRDDLPSSTFGSSYHLSDFVYTEGSQDPRRLANIRSCDLNLRPLSQNSTRLQVGQGFFHPTIQQMPVQLQV